MTQAGHEGAETDKRGTFRPDRFFWLIGRHARTVLSFVQQLTFTAYLLDVCSLCHKNSRWEGQQA